MGDGNFDYTLYGTSACHLCELAEALLESVGDAVGRPAFQKVDISESDELFERYGVRIPVLRHRSGEELGWPFSAQELRLFLSR
ncbi:MAG: glutaredoxin family protein [Halioglobus sp.]